MYVVVAGFRSKPVKFYMVDMDNLTFPQNQQTVGYQEFCEKIFKPKIQWAIDRFIQRYISVLPEDLRLSIYTIENSIDSMIFMTPLQIGHNTPMPTTEQDIKELKKQFKLIGNAFQRKGVKIC